MNENLKNFLTMRELQEKLKLSRQTITRYIKAGLPRIKKGHENLFDFSEVSKWIERNDSNPGYAKLMYEAQELYPDDPLRVLEHIRLHGNNYSYLLAMAEITQSIYSMHYGKVKVDAGLVDYFFRGFLDVIRNLPKNLPAGKYQYMTSRVEDLVIELIKQSDRPKYIQRHKSFFHDKILYPDLTSKYKMNDQIHETFFSKEVNFHDRL